MKKPRMTVPFGLVLLLAAPLTACAGTSNTIACSLAILAPPVMVDPAPNATAVPDNIGRLVLAYSGGTVWTPPVLTAPNGSQIQGGPYTSIPSSVPAEYSSSITPLAPATTYTVQSTYGQTPCRTTRTLGSFTTQ